MPEIIAQHAEIIATACAIVARLSYKFLLWANDGVHREPDLSAIRCNPWLG